MTRFNERCYKLLKKVPSGKVVSYKEIARKLKTHAYRAVGNAMNKNKDLVNIRCYKVVRDDGMVGGYLKGVKKKIQLLKAEGVEVVNGRIDMKKYGWNFNY